LSEVATGLHEKTSAAAAPMNPKNGAISSPLFEEVILPCGHETNWIRNEKPNPPRTAQKKKNYILTSAEEKKKLHAKN
jgi:hypothetical protein